MIVEILQTNSTVLTFVDFTKLRLVLLLKALDFLNAIRPYLTASGLWKLRKVTALCSRYGISSGVMNLGHAIKYLRYASFPSSPNSRLKRDLTLFKFWAVLGQKPLVSALPHSLVVWIRQYYSRPLPISWLSNSGQMLPWKRRDLGKKLLSMLFIVSNFYSVEMLRRHMGS